MTEVQPQIIQSNVQVAEAKGKDILVSAGNNQVDVVNLTTIPKMGGWKSSDQNVQSECAGSNMQWQINVDSNKTINTLNSYFSYRVKFVQQINTGGYMNPYTGASVALDNTSSTPTTDFCHKIGLGKYYVKSGFYWYEPCKLKDTVTGAEAPYTHTITVLPGQFYPPIAISTWAQNSLCILNRTQVTLGSDSNIDDWVFRQRAIYQMNLSKEFQDMQCDTWFDGNDKVFQIDAFHQSAANTWDAAFTNCPDYVNDKTVKPGLYKTGTATLGNYVFYHTFIIPLGLVNQYLMADNQLNMGIFQRQIFQINLFLQDYSVVKCFSSTLNMIQNQCGICTFDLKLYTKKSASFTADMIDKTGIIYNYRKYDYQTNATINTINDFQNVEMSYGHNSHNDIYLMGQMNDASIKTINPTAGGIFQDYDSTYLHQKFTFLSAQQQLDIINNRCPYAEIFPFFNNIQIVRGNESNEVYSEPLNDISELIRETYRSQGMIGCIDYSSSNWKKFDRFFKYTIHMVSLEAFSKDSFQDDVLYDGYNSKQHKIRVKFSLHLFQGGQNDTSNQYADITSTDAFGSLNNYYKVNTNIAQVQFINIYDQMLKINTQTGQVRSTEELM